eukprot:30706-Pelagococcus_subviridis.AAC.8
MARSTRYAICASDMTTRGSVARASATDSRRSSSSSAASSATSRQSSFKATSGWHSKASDGVERRRGVSGS